MEKLTPEIIFEDEDILVVNKPAGMIVNNADTSAQMFTLQDWVEDQLKIKSEKLKVEEKNDFHNRAGIVHRLDKETSGLNIIAKNEESFKALQAQFKGGRVEKTYITLVHGKVIPETGEINVPIGRLPWNRMRFGVLPQGRESRTLYKVTKNLRHKTAKGEEDLSLVEVYPKTGRTHQIRVHFLHIGHPLFADALYGGRKTYRSDKQYLSRHFLHAAKISFFHPGSGEQLTLESPLPEELSQFLKNLI